MDEAKQQRLRKANAEALWVLEHLNEEDRSRIPETVFEGIRKGCEPGYVPQFEEGQGIPAGICWAAKLLLGVIYMQYMTKTEEEREWAKDLLLGRPPIHMHKNPDYQPEETDDDTQ